MLLYDRVLESMTRANAPALKASSFHRVPVYEISSVVPLFADYTREMGRSIQRRPPFPCVWCEWQEDFACPSLGTVSYTFGSLIFPFKAGGAFGELFSPLDDDNENYASMPFGMVRRYEKRPVDGGSVNSPFAFQHYLKVQMADDSSRVRLFKESALPTVGEFWGLDTASRGPGDDVGRGYYDHVVESASWPPFMAFALLHCKNVVAEEHAPEERIQRECKKHNRPPRVTYKTLKIEVPKTVHQRQAYEPGTEDDGPKVRFHLCSGHFKNLQHERFKSKGWHWWPAHWRGSQELGRVEKTYKLTAVEANDTHA